MNGGLNQDRKQFQCWNYLLIRYSQHIGEIKSLQVHINTKHNWKTYLRERETSRKLSFSIKNTQLLQTIENCKYKINLVIQNFNVIHIKCLNYPITHYHLEGHRLNQQMSKFVPTQKVYGLLSKKKVWINVHNLRNYFNVARNQSSSIIGWWR
jgi:hypothetical protein